MSSGSRSNIELVVTDLDGTLWDADCNLHRGALSTIAELSRRNIAVLAATARGPTSTFKTFARLGLSMPAVLCNGALGRWSNGDSFHRAVFSVAAVQELLAIFAEVGLVPHFAVDHPSYGAIAPRRTSSCAAFNAQLGQGIVEGDLQMVLTHDVTQLRVLGIAHDALVAAAHACSLRDDTRVYFAKDSFFGQWSLQVAPIAADKWAGVVAYCGVIGIDSSAVLGIGDGTNDVGYLSRAKAALAMPDSAPEVLEVAHHVLAPDNTWSGVLEYV